MKPKAGLGDSFTWETPPEMTKTYQRSNFDRQQSSQTRNVFSG
jgi:hypothetical protein